jgi:RimJ/RimL family protein N-acetyltransferase
MTELRSERLLLRPLCLTDLDAVFAILGDAETTAAVSWRQPSRESAAVWLARRLDDQRECGVSMWGVELHSTRQLVGLCGFFPRHVSRWELGYVLHARHWGQGLATEAVSLAVEHARGLGQAIFATIRASNVTSRRVAERAGFRLSKSEPEAPGELLLYEQ